MKPDDLFIGLMSGTSLDAIDSVIAKFGTAGSDDAVQLLAARNHPFPDTIRTRLLEVISNIDSISPDSLTELDDRLGMLYAEAVNALLAEAGYTHTQIRAIGNHGQTVLHNPDADPGISLQLGNGQIIADTTGITTVVDFRSADIALGGQGAPLVPGFHSFAFARPGIVRTIVNIGGIANITVLGGDGSVTGFDTGPGNTLLDLWAHEHLGKRFDDNGNWAAGGQTNEQLLERMLNDEYFLRLPPKSTGREYFNREWLETYLQDSAHEKAENVQATLLELTARSIAAAIKTAAAGSEVLVCGGGAANSRLMAALQQHLRGQPTAKMPAEILPPDWVEAAAFAWLARARLNNEPAGLPSVTGASGSALLGRICTPVEA